MARYTVIGARGFIGSAMTARLQAHGADVFTPQRGEELDASDLGRVIYCAGLTGDYRSRPFDAVEAHVGLLSRIIDAGCFDRLIYLSSTRLYDATPDIPGREEAPLKLQPDNPDHVYELSKALGENLAVSRSGGRGVAARLSYVFDEAPGSGGFLSAWLDKARRDKALTLASSPALGRDYIHRQDAVAALHALADGEVNGIVNVAEGRVTTNAELAEVFEQAGWRVAFEREGGPAPTLAPSVERLRGLGISVSDTRARVAKILARL